MRPLLLASWLTMTALSACMSGRIPPDSQEASLGGTHHHQDCFAAGAFLPVEKDRLTRVLPAGFLPLDGEVVGRAFAGKAVWGLAGWACPGSPGRDRHSFLMVVSLVRPPVSGDVADSANLHWYEHARLVEGEEMYHAWRDLGLNVQRGQFKHTPFDPVLQTVTFSGIAAGGEILAMTAKLDRAVEFPGTTLLFWQETSSGLLYSQFVFRPHPARLGSLATCNFHFDGILEPPMASIPCPSQALMEVNERIEFTSAVRRWPVWRGHGLKPE